MVNHSFFKQTEYIYSMATKCVYLKIILKNVHKQKYHKIQIHRQQRSED